MDNSYTNLLEAIWAKKLIVFGCGNFFREFMFRYPSLGGRIEYILDNSPKADSFVYNEINISVIHPIEIRKVNLMKYVIVFCAKQWKEMKEQLDEILNQEYCYFYYPLEVDYRENRNLGIYHRIVVPAIEKLREYSKTKNVVELLGLSNEAVLINGLKCREFHTIPRLTVVLTPKCSLRCKECNNLMWRFTDHYILSSEKIIASLGNVIEQLDFVPCVELIGGEPFVAQNLKEILGFLLEQKKVLSIEITTNATIVPSRGVLNQIKNPKVFVHISSYGNVVNQDRFIDCMKENGIQFSLLEFHEKWIATGGIEKRHRDAEELIRQYYQCTSGYLCKTLWEDRIYPCARAASLATLGVMPECPYVDSAKRKDLRERLYSFYVEASCGACDYCDVAIENPVYVEPAVQLEMMR